jgi:predicted nucleic acid-binding protein
LGSRVILLDTNVLIDLDRCVLDPAETFGASILSRAELEFGVRAAQTPEATAERVRRLNWLDEHFDWLPFDVASSRSYGVIAAQAKASGARVRGKDALIAAQAHRFGAALVTSNIDDFRPFEHLVRILAPTLRP